MKPFYVLAIIALSLALLGTVLTVVLFLRPATDMPRQVDAVVVLSGDHGERLPAAMRLIDTGVTSTLVIDGSPDYPAVVELCNAEGQGPHLHGGPRPFEIVCVISRPDNTRGEARAASKLAATRHWLRIAVVTSTQHVTRSRLRFERCFHGDLQMVGAARHYQRTSDMVAAVAHEWLGLVQALATRQC